AAWRGLLVTSLPQSLSSARGTIWSDTANQESRPPQRLLGRSLKAKDNVCLIARLETPRVPHTQGSRASDENPTTRVSSVGALVADEGDIMEWSWYLDELGCVGRSSASCEPPKPPSRNSSTD